MYKIKIKVIILSALLMSCNRQINTYRDKQKHGRWIHKSSEQSFSRGRYVDGKQAGTWKTFEEGKLYRKERFGKSASIVKFYHPNRRLMSKGQTRVELTPTHLHWYYSGIWSYYDAQGKLTEKRIYDKGQLVEADSTASN
jgi:antitoxin component YwqK of YwqJK toxin-antitoxin module